MDFSVRFYFIFSFELLIFFVRLNDIEYNSLSLSRVINNLTF